MVNAMPRTAKLDELRCWVLLALISSGILSCAGNATAQNASNDNLARCRIMTDDAARLRCFEEVTKPATNAVPQTPPATSTPATWRLVRTPNPGGGKDAVSIMKTADTTKSDLDLAGLMVRCGETGLETLVVLVTPLPPRAHPSVTASTGSQSSNFTATVVPPGAELLLPKEATALTTGPWTTAAELSLEMKSDDEQVKGTIPLAGLGASLTLLAANCRQR